jgi:hypothetical protein
MIHYEKMSPLDYYAFLSADSQRWGAHEREYLSMVYIYDRVLPAVGFGYLTFLAKIKSFLN